MPLALELRHLKLALHAAQDRVNRPGVQCAIRMQRFVDRENLQSMREVGDFGHDKIPPCQFDQAILFDLGEFKRFHCHLAAMVSRADLDFGFGEDHAGFVR